MVLNEAILREQGILYPDCMRIGPGHHPVVHATKARDISLIKQLLEAASGFETLVLSSENFTKLSVSEIRVLTEVFSGWDIQILFYYRGCHEVWPSHWQETIKHGSFDIWPNYLTTVLGFSHRVELGFVDPMIVLGNWAQVLAVEKLNIFPFAGVGSHPRDVLRPVCKLVGVDVDLLQVEEKGRNASYSAERIEAIRMLNLHAFTTGMAKNSSVRRSYMKQAEDIERTETFAAHKVHFKQHTKKSVVHQNTGYLAHLEDVVVDAFGRRFMQELPEKSSMRSKTVSYLDPAFPVPKEIVLDLFNRL